VPTLSLWDGLRAVRLKLWDEDCGRLVTFAQARAVSLPRVPHQGEVPGVGVARGVDLTRSTGIMFRPNTIVCR
jgi:hypothetical protein